MLSRSRPRPVLKLALAALLAVPLFLGAGTSGADYAEINGIRMYYELRGKGSPLLLLHGGAGSGLQFISQIPDLERNHRLVIPDMRAQGRTGVGTGPLTYHVMAEDVIALMDRLRIRRFDVLGWSDGGVTGLDLAIHHPRRVGHLVTFGANFSPEGMREQDLAWVDTATVAAFGQEMRSGWMALSPEPGQVVDALGKILRMWKEEPRFTPAQLGAIRAKTMICAGENDVVRRDHTDSLSRMIPMAKEWIVPAASHSALQEKPAETNAKILEFLSH
jgi:pimeloyl-ACP methyl ester carboxylesterase